MTTAVLTFGQIKAQVAAVRKRNSRERVIGIQAPGRWTGERHEQDGHDRYVIEQCDSPLAMRIALRDNTEGEAIKVLITGLDEKELGEDILLRLAKRRLFTIDNWQLVKARFQARTVDPRVSQQAWIADYLLEAAPIPPAPGGFLDAETVWAVLLERQIGLSGDRPDLLALLKWSTEEAHVERLRAAPELFRQAMTDWFNQCLGPVAKLIIDCLLRRSDSDVLPVGLAAGIVFNQGLRGRLDKAAGKMEERYFGGETPDTALIERWRSAATEVVSLQLADDPRKRRALLKRADEILEELQAEAYAYVSDISPHGFKQRLARFGRLLSEAIDNGPSRSLPPLSEAWQAVEQHEQFRSSDERRRLDRGEMALRLVRWLEHVATSSPTFSSLGETAQYHADEGGFVDWARFQVRGSEPVPELSKAYEHLFETVTAIREQHARRFAELLQDATASASNGAQLIPVENILDEIVTPLAEHTPVLVIVIDGMSSAVRHELVASITRQDWISLCEDGHEKQRPGLAVLPSVTQASRTSLLCGKLSCGDATDEQRGFATHPGLLQHGRSSLPPKLFHKAALQTEGEREKVRNTILHPQQRVVGVVINAVDDLLLKGDQLDIRWSKDEIRILPTLLDAAEAAGRVVILLADHGHVLEHHTRSLQQDGGGERWRMDDGHVTDGELVLRGPRILMPDAQRLIAPWTERIRYGPKKSGYHGGISPQEMIVPIAVLSVREPSPDWGWTTVSIETPDWWQKTPQLAPQDTNASAQELTQPQEPSGLPLFDFVQTRQGGSPDWIHALLNSPVFTKQKESARQAEAVDKHLAVLLEALDQAEGKLSLAAFARAVKTPAARLNGLIAVLQQVLNIDGYQILSRNEDSGSIELNRDLLCRQFEIDGDD